MVFVLSILALVAASALMASAVVANNLVSEANDKGCSVIDILEADLQ